MTAERGSASALAVAAVGVLLAVTVGALGLAAAVSGATRAATAADQAALAVAVAAGAGLSPAVACARGADIAARNRSRLESCTISKGDALVRASTDVRLPVLLGGRRRASAEARAGPASGG